MESGKGLQHNQNKENIRRRLITSLIKIKVGRK
jgi:hypothetical protein